MKNLAPKDITQIAIFAGVIVIFAAIGVFLPLLMIFTSLINTVILCVLVVRIGALKSSLIIPVVFVVTLLFTGNPVSAFDAVVSFAFSGIFLGLAINKKTSFVSTLFLTSLGYLCYAFSTFIFINIITNGNALKILVNDPFEQSKALTLSYIGQSGKLFGLTENDYKDATDKIMQNMKTLVPLALILGAAVWGYISIWYANIILKKLNFELPSLIPFKSFHMDKVFTFMVFITMLISMFLDSNTVIYTVLSSLTYFAWFLYMICGVSVIDYFCFNKNVNKPLRIIIVIMLFLTSPVFFFLLIIIGMVDSTLDIRKWIDKVNKDGKKEIS